MGRKRQAKAPVPSPPCLFRWRPAKTRGGDEYHRNDQEKGAKTYNTGDSLVVTDPTTSLTLTNLSRGERTGSRVLQRVWSFVQDWLSRDGFEGVSAERQAVPSTRVLDAICLELSRPLRIDTGGLPGCLLAYHHPGADETVS